MFSKILIANRGEIAVRVARTCRDVGVAVVAVHSDADASARHVAMADEAVHLPGVAAAETYLDVDAIVEAALRTGAQAVHPGYGFLAERGDAARAVRDAGLVWIGPSPEAIQAVGDKLRARSLARAAGAPVAPGTLEPVGTAGEVQAFGEANGYPIAIKATGGGGGKGFRVAWEPDGVSDALEGARREAAAYFGSPAVYLERYLSEPKHIEIQVLSPAPGRAMWIGARDCSLQRRHQKLVEETPPPRFADIVPEMGAAAVAVANACGYTNAGTVEFLVDERGAFSFLEVNARLQVEHTITEAVTGLDLVACQLRIAAGEPLGFEQDDVPALARGHAVECRINAEDPARGFVPTPGRLERYREPAGPGIRVDSGFAEGDTVPDAYDSLLAKLVAVAPTREEARRRMLRGLAEFEIRGVASTIPAHLLLLDLPAFVDGSYSTRTVEEGALDPLATGPAEGAPDAGAGRPAIVVVNGAPARLWNPAVASSISSAGAAADGSATVSAPMHGTILQVLVAEGDRVDAGDPVAILEAMKMETVVAASTAGRVEDVRVVAGAVVESSEVIAVVAAERAPETP